MEALLLNKGKQMEEKLKQEHDRIYQLRAIYQDYIKANREWLEVMPEYCELVRKQMVSKMSSRLHGILIREGWDTDYLFTQLTPEKLLRMQNFGIKSLYEFENVLKDHNYEWKK
jgi:DNA-directed RNA polymerase alpha subunit